MIKFFLSLLSAIPGIASAASFITGKIFDAKVAITTARIGGDVSVATEMVKAAAIAEQARVSALSVIAGSWVLSALVIGFSGPFIIYEWKVIVWDIVLKWGTTDPIRLPMLTDWGGTIIACLFGSGTVLTIGHLYYANATKP